MTNLKFACADYTFPLLVHEKVLSLIAMLNCEGVDIGLFSGRSHLTPESEFQRSSHKANTLKKQLDDRGLIASDVYLQLATDFFMYAINHPEKKRRVYARENFLNLIEYAHYLGADHVTCIPGMCFLDEAPKASIERCYEELSWRLDMAGKSEITFAVEIHIGCPFINPAYTAALINSVPGLSLTLDYTHFIYEGFTQIEVDSFLGNASHFHARGGKKGRLQTIMSDNIIDYKSIAKKLEKLNYNGWIGLEYIWTDWARCNEVDTLSETILLRDIIKAACTKDGT